VVTKGPSLRSTPPPWGVGEPPSRACLEAPSLRVSDPSSHNHSQRRSSGALLKLQDMDKSADHATLPAVAANATPQWLGMSDLSVARVFTSLEFLFGS
jgi:hypothetical protein